VHVAALGSRKRLPRRESKMQSGPYGWFYAPQVFADEGG